jgi:hypothetical protein
VLKLGSERAKFGTSRSPRANVSGYRQKNSTTLQISASVKGVKFVATLASVIL